MTTKNLDISLKYAIFAPKIYTYSMIIEHGKHVALQYKLTGYDTPETPDETPELEEIEETKEGHPFEFIYGVGQLIAGFEKNIDGLKEGDTFDFTLPPSEAYGEYRDEDVHEVPIRMEDLRRGGFPMEFVKVGSELPLQNANGEIMQSEIIRVEKQQVICRLDLNHPMAGMTLHFVGKILEVREATEQDKIEYMRQMTGSASCGCGGGCGGCQGGCGGGDCGGCQGGCGGGCNK